MKLSPCRGSTLLQTVSVQPVNCYQLSYYMNCIEGEALAAVRVEWLDENGGLLELGGEQITDVFYSGLNIWKQYRIILPPVPAICSWARISFSARGGQVLLDNVSFTAI
ncbi:MAG: hypothetical protein ACM3NT_02345 [Methylocystaceae bacterium]